MGAAIMAAHLRGIYERKCYTCGKKATVTLHNTRNEELNAYCQKHGGIALKEEARQS